MFSEKTTKNTLLKYFTSGQLNNCNNSSKAVQEITSISDPGYKTKPSNIASTSRHETHDNLPIITSRYVPSKNFLFPKNESNWSCQIKWFQMFPWLHYDISRNVVLCYECIRAYNNEKCHTDIHDIELSFIKIGFRNWKKAMEKFRVHERSAYHTKSVHNNSIQNKGTQIINLLSTKSKVQQEEAYCALGVIVSSINYLARTGQALQGQTMSSGNLMELVQERARDVPALKNWLNRRDKWLSVDIQNELIEIMAHSIQRNIIKDVKNSYFWSMMVDGTTDISGNEQFTLCVRYVEKHTLEIREKFIGMYNPPDSKSETLLLVIKDMAIRLGLEFETLRGHCFDGASNMSGRMSGVRQRINEVQPKSVYIHCSNHALDLTLQEISRSCDIICDSLSIIKDVSNIILESAKRKSIYSNLVLPPTRQDNEDSINKSNLLPLCPTRWAVRVKSINRFIENYNRIQATLEELLKDRGSIRDDRRAAIKGYSKKLLKSETLLALNVSKCIFGPCEELARSLQNVRYSASGAKKASDYLIKTLRNLRSDAQFNNLWDTTKIMAQEISLKDMSEPRIRKVPRRFEQTDNPSTSAVLNAKGYLRKEFFTVLDLLISEVERRFCQPGMDQMIKLESIIINSIVRTGLVHTLNELKQGLGIYAEDFDIDRLQAQLTLLPTIFEKEPPKPSYITEIAAVLKKQPDMLHNVLDQVVRLISLILTIPASAASAERSFSSVRRIKTYLRSTMTQKRLCNLLILNIHKESAGTLDLNEVQREFILRTSERRAMFGLE